MTLETRDLGLVDYARAHSLQEACVEQRLAGGPDTLLLLEHPAVITLGRGTEPSNVVDPGEIPVIPCERGGDVTLHAPGQLVGYVIRRLEDGPGGLHRHLRAIEETLLQVCALYGLAAERRPGATGVWVAERKIASIGIACRRHVTWHGFALNVSTDLALFRRINPCGFEASVMTSLEVATGRHLDMSLVKTQCAQALAAVLNAARA